MSAETLRRAAALMRERAEDSPLSSPWVAVEGASGGWWIEQPNTADVVPEVHDGRTAEHIASWHPAVALAVADLLDSAAGHVEYTGRLDDEDIVAALAVARAYLGGAA